MNDALDALIGRSTHALSAMYDASEILAGIRVTTRSEDGTVAVTVDGSGAMVDVQLAEDLSRASARELGITIVTTASEAASQALEHRASVLGRMQSSLSDT